jgi:hypothetical protein
VTSFRLAKTPGDFRKCHALLRKANREAATKLSFPTVMALREEELVAFISTADPQKAKVVCVGEMVVDPEIKNPIHLMFDLVETYDAFMTSIGMQIYYFTIPVDQKQWIETIKKSGGATFVEEVGGLMFFRRETTNFKKKGVA